MFSLTSVHDDDLHEDNNIINKRVLSGVSTLWIRYKWKHFKSLELL